MLKRIDQPHDPDQGYAPVESREPTGFDLREAINFAWRQWKFIGAIVALALLIGLRDQYVSFIHIPASQPHQ